MTIVRLPKGILFSIAAFASTASAAPMAATWAIPLSPDLHWSAANAERLSCLGRHLAGHPDQAVIIEGHLDRQGTREYALGISDRPAMDAVGKLIEAGAASRQAHAIGLGFERAECPTMACMKRNRRLVVRANEGGVLPNCPLNDRDAELGLAPWPFPYASSLTVCVQALQEGRQGVCSRNQWAELAKQHAGNERPRAFDDYLEVLAQEEEVADGDVEVGTLTSWPVTSQQAWVAVTAALLPRDAAIARLKEAATAPERSPLWTSSLTALIRIDSENRKGWALKIFGACLLPDGNESRCAHWPTEWIHGALRARDILELGSTLSPSESMFTLTLAGLMRDTDHQRFTQAVFGCGEHCFPDLAYAPASIQSLARRGGMSRGHSHRRPSRAAATTSQSGTVEMPPHVTSEVRGEGASTPERQTDPPQLSHPTPPGTADACVPDPATAALRAKLEAQLPTLDVEGLCSIAPEERALIRGSAKATERLVELVRNASPEGLHNPFIEGRSLRSARTSCGLMTLLEEQLYYDTPENDALATAATEAAPPALQLIGARYLIRNDGDREVARRLWEALSESPVSGAALAEFELRAALDWTNRLPVRTPPLSLCEGP